MGCIVWLDDPAASQPAVVGPKAATQAVLLQAGFPVPLGFVLTAEAARQQFSSKELRTELEQLTEAIRSDRDCSREATALRAVLASSELQAEIAEALLQAFRELRSRGADLLAVRSSAVVENRAEASFAGQLSTFLGVSSPEELLSAVRGCWASRWSDRVIGYAMAHALEPHDPAMAVLVQGAIPAEAAGAATSTEPTGADDSIVVNGAWGLGRAVAEGEVAADYWRIDRTGSTIRERRIGRKPLAASLSAEAGEVWQPVRGERATAPCLEDQTIRDLASLVSLVELLFGAPQEIEWAFAEGRLWLLQARPLHLSAPETAEAPGLRDIDWYAVWVARRLAPHLVPAPAPWSLATEWPELLASVLAPLALLGAAIPQPEDVFSIQDGVAVRLEPRWPVDVRSADVGAHGRAPALPRLASQTLAFLQPEDLSRHDEAKLVELAEQRRGRYAVVNGRNLLLAVDLLAPWLMTGTPVEGQPTSGGRVVGRARVVRSPEDVQLVQAGEIVIATLMRPTMTALLPTIGGLVVEAGGSTSHTANLARERRIPAIMGALGAIHRISDGALVLLDGTAGKAWSRT